MMRPDYQMFALLVSEREAMLIYPASTSYKLIASVDGRVWRQVATFDNEAIANRALDALQAQQFNNIITEEPQQ